MSQRSKLLLRVVDHSWDEMGKVVLDTLDGPTSLSAIVVARVAIDHLEHKRKNLLVLTRSRLAFLARREFELLRKCPALEAVSAWYVINGAGCFQSATETADRMRF